MIKKALHIWYKKLKSPSQKDEFSFERLNGTNIYLVKDYHNRIGLLLADTLQISKSFRLKNFDFHYHDKLENNKNGIVLSRCQMILANKSVEPDFLIRILFGILEIESEGQISSHDLINVLKELKRTFDPEEQKRNVIIGVWGELYFLNKLLSNPMKKDRILAILNGWEGDIGSMKVDMRFEFCKLAFEIKTTTNEDRVHHISGHEQFNVPSGFNNLFLVSIRILEDNAGYTCKDLLEEIILSIKDKQLINEFNERLLIRGKTLCNDDFYHFTPRDNNPFAFFDSASFQLPTRPIGVTNMEWNQNFDSVKVLDKKRVDQVMLLINN